MDSKVTTAMGIRSTFLTENADQTHCSRTVCKRYLKGSRIFNPLNTQSDSQNYFTTGGFPPISSSWRQAPWDPFLQHLWREDGSVVYNCCWASPAQSFLVHDHILLSQIRDSPQLRGPGPRIYIPQEQGGPIIPPGNGFHFRHLLRLAGLQWRYSTPLKCKFLVNNI
jgi:hypothetical protein